MDAFWKPIRVMLADDNVDLTAAVRRLLDLEPDVACVGCVADARLVISEVARCEPKVLVMDLSMPGGDTATIIRELQSIAPDVRTIVFSGFGDDERIERSLTAGAWRFVRKESGPQELLDAIRAAASDLVAASR
jgi:DNA-binding NarL/FixJ family response regulator